MNVISSMIIHESGQNLTPKSRDLGVFFTII